MSEVEDVSNRVNKVQNQLLGGIVGILIIVLGWLAALFVTKLDTLEEMQHEERARDRVQDNRLDYHSRRIRSIELLHRRAHNLDDEEGPHDET